MHSKSKVYFFNQNVKPALNGRIGLKRYIESIFKKEDKILASVNYIFCTDRALLKINRQFLKHDFYTDIITFDLSETKAITAEIYISVDRVRENARTLGISIKSELLRVIFHGALHLCGFNDKTRKEKAIMIEKEDFYLSHYSK